jgi:HEXXH motif-containing protein
MVPARLEASMSLVSAHVLGADPGDEPLQVRYFRALNRVQKRQFDFDPEGRGPLRAYDTGVPWVREALAYFMQLGPMNPGEAGASPRDWMNDDEHRCTPEEIAVVEERMAGAEELIARYDSMFPAVMTLVVGSFIFGKRHGMGGGSIGDTVGVIWLNPRSTATALEYAEKIVHETTHQATFLYEMVHTLFSATTVEMEKPEALVTSSLRRIPRGYHRSFHSACVGVALTELYEELGAPATAARFCRPTMVTLSELRDKSRYLTEPGLAVLEEMERFVAKPRPCLAA